MGQKIMTALSIKGLTEGLSANGMKYGKPLCNMPDLQLCDRFQHVYQDWISTEELFVYSELLLMVLTVELRTRAKTNFPVERLN